MPFPDMDVSVTLTGEEWTVLIARWIRKPLSEKGEAIYHNASKKLREQLLAASDTNPSIVKKPADFLEGG